MKFILIICMYLSDNHYCIGVSFYSSFFFFNIVLQIICGL